MVCLKPYLLTRELQTLKKTFDAFDQHLTQVESQQFTRPLSLSNSPLHRFFTTFLKHPPTWLAGCCPSICLFLYYFLSNAPPFKYKLTPPKFNSKSRWTVPHHAVPSFFKSCCCLFARFLVVKIACWNPFSQFFF